MQGNRFRLAAFSGVAVIGLAGLIAACGTGSSTDVSSTLQPQSTGGTVVTPSGNGNVQLNLKITQGREVPTTFTNLVVVGLDANNKEVFRATVAVKSSILVENVPVTVKNLHLEYQNSSGVATGQSNLPLALSAGQTVTITDPSYDNVILSVSADFLQGTYTVSGADSGSVRGGLLNGQLTFDGAGKVTGGSLTRRDATSTSGPPTTFTVTGGSYTVDGDRVVSATLTTNQYPLRLQGKGSLNTSGQSVYGVLAGDNGSSDALSGFVYLQKQNVSAKVIPGQYNISGLSVGLFGTPGFYNGQVTLKDDGSIASGSLTGPTGSSLAVSGGNWAVDGAGALTGSLSVGTLGNLTLSGSAGSDAFVSFNGLASTSGDFLYFAGMPQQPTVSTPNVPISMALEGMRTVTGGMTGSTSISIGAGQMLGGTFTEYVATAVPIRLNANQTLPPSTFTLSSDNTVSGSGEGTVGTVRLVRGLFSPDGSVYIGSIDAVGVGALGGGQSFTVLAK